LAPPEVGVLTGATVGDSVKDPAEITVVLKELLWLDLGEGGGREALSSLFFSLCAAAERKDFGSCLRSVSETPS
jgi:hypothetical protein